MIRKESTTWREDTAHAAKVAAVVLVLIILGFSIIRPLDQHARDADVSGYSRGE